MQDAVETAWWRDTGILAAATSGLAAITALLALAIASGGGMSVFGTPLGTFFAVVAAPVAILVGVFVFAVRQQAIDRRHRLSED